MKFSIGYNHDIKLLSLLDVYEDNIEAFYFPIPRQYLGSGRHITQKSNYVNEIPKIIKKCNSLNIKSQLLLNATCAGELGLEKKFFLKIINYIQKLKDLGLKSVIVTNSVYISGIKEQIKGIEIESSINCYVKTVEHALYLKDLGVDILTVDRDINRDIPLIKEIKDKTGLKIKILLNEGCLRNCPFRKAHFNFIAHAQLNPKVEMIDGIFFEKWCMKIFSKNPEKIFSIPFISPDALKYYTQVGDYFKISSRDSSTSLIEFRLKAYINQNFNGNLLLLLDCAGLLPYFSYVDSKVLNENNFFKKMLKCTHNCNECNYCSKLVNEAVITNSYFLDPSHPIRIKESEKAVKMYKRILKNFPNKGAIYIDLAKAYFILKRYKEAIKEANKAIELNYKEGHLILGFCYEKTKQYKKAIRELKKAEKINPEEFHVNLSLSNYYKNIGQTEQASKELEKGVLKFKRIQQAATLNIK
ncbi:MAG: tetratricopeptide repeat protein [Candidatus Kaelpia imicola]|nr:tetratricopeptide repeat protein [Candidatus Kaelpia imicola]